LGGLKGNGPIQGGGAHGNPVEHAHAHVSKKIKLLQAIAVELETDASCGRRRALEEQPHHYDTRGCGVEQDLHLCGL
jgi:hypothetical protein